MYKLCNQKCSDAIDLILFCLQLVGLGGQSQRHTNKRKVQRLDDSFPKFEVCKSATHYWIICICCVGNVIHFKPESIIILILIAPYFCTDLHSIEGCPRFSMVPDGCRC